MGLSYKKLESVLAECDKHIERLEYIKKKLDKYMPLTIEKYENLNQDEIGLFDQLIFRFIKLQDTMGEKLLKLFLIYKGENVKEKTFIDILNRLEELNILKKEDWLELRAIRNLITHEYPELEEEIVNGLNKVYFEYIEKLLKILKKINVKIKEGGFNEIF